MYLVISCQDHSIDIIEEQETHQCRQLFRGSYLECEEWKQEFMEEAGYIPEGWGNTKLKNYEDTE